MNHLYRLVFNPALKTVQVVSEIVTGSRPGRAPSPAQARSLAVHLLVPALALACSGAAHAAGPLGWNEWREVSNDWYSAGNWSSGVPTRTGVASYIDDNRHAVISSGQAESNHLHVGYAGHGRLSISTGGRLRTQTIFMAHDMGSSARVDIDGTGSTWRSDTTIGVGHQGQGEVNITNQGTLDIGLDSYVGATPTGNGRVVASGAGSRFLTGRALLVGNEGTGQVAIVAGAGMTSGEGWLGNTITGSGAVEISGAGSSWINTGNLHVGNFGTGSVLVTDGGSVSGGAAIWLGRQPIGAPRSNGTLVVATGGTFTGSGMMVVGGSGDGDVTVRGGGSVSIANAVTLAEQLGSTGRVLVTGADSQWSSGSLRIGANADAEFAVNDGGFASVRNVIEIALMVSSSGRLSIGNDAVLRVGDGTAGQIIGGSGDAALVMNGGTLQGNGALMVSAAMQMQADSSVQSNDSVDLWGRISGAGQLRKSGTGTLTLHSANTHDGGVRVDGGILQLQDNLAAGTGTLALNDATALAFGLPQMTVANAVQLQGAVNAGVAAGGTVTLTGAVGDGGGSGRLVKTGDGTLTLSASNTYSGGTNISSGMLKIEKNDALGTGTVDLHSGGSLGLAATGLVLGNALALSGNADLVVWPGGATLTGVISDGTTSGALYKSGAGELTLTSANSFSGGLQMAQGTLTLGNNTAAGTGTLRMLDFTQLAFGSSGLNIANTLQLGSSVRVSVDDAAQLSGAISDAGSNGQLVKDGAGTLTVSGNNTYSGGTRLREGTLAVTSSNALGSGELQMRAGSTLALAGNDLVLGNAITLDGEGRIEVASGSATLSGVLSDGETAGGITIMSASVVPSAMPAAPGLLLKTGAGELVLAADSSYSGGTRIEAGQLRLRDYAAIAGDIEIAAGAGLDLARADHTRFGGVLSGAGQLRKLDAGMLWLSADSSAFNGQTLIQNGRLFVEGQLGGALTLAADTLLGGTGTLGNVSLLDGATLAPGLVDQVGTLNVAGNLTFSQGARYVADVAADGRNDWVHVAGTAVLGNAGTVALARGSDWAPSTRYTLLTADQAVQGVFAGVSSNFAFLDPHLEYDANNVYLTLARNDIALPDVELAFPQVELNSNQKQVAGAVQAMGNGAAVYDAVVRLEVQQVAPAFDSLSGEIHAAHRGTLLQNRFLHDGIDRHLDGVATAAELAPGVHAWVAGSGGQRRRDANAENAGLRASQHGMMAGAGWRMGESLEVGVAAGQQQLVSRLALREARAETDSTEYGVYAQYRWQGLGLRAGVTRAEHRTDSTRTAQVGSTLSESLVAREDATGTTAFVRAGWSFGGPRLQLTPEVELAQVRLRSDGSQERGGDSALQLDAGNARYRTGLAALRADWNISGGQRDRAALTARVGWQVAGGDRLPQANVRFVQGEQAFGIAGAPLARRSALAQLGVAISPTDSSRVSLQMQGRRGDGQRDLGAQLDWSLAF